jgi:hypothetical protein
MREITTLDVSARMMWMDSQMHFLSYTTHYLFIQPLSPGGNRRPTAREIGKSEREQIKPASGSRCWLVFLQTQAQIDPQQIQIQKLEHE